MKEFTAAEKGEHVMYAPVNNDIQAKQIENAYIPYTQEVVDAADQFMTYFALAKLKAMDAAPAVFAVEAAPATAVVVETAPAVAAVKSAPAVVAVVAAPAAAVVVETAPAVAAVKSAPVVEAVKPAPAAAVVPTFYRMPAVHGYP